MLPIRLVLPIFLIALLGGCASEPPFKPTDDQATLPSYGDRASYNKPYKVKGKTYYPLVSASGYREKGLASWYGSESGNRTATGSRFNPKDLTAAHKTLPLPCKVRVTNLRNGRYIDVEVNDRGPFNDARLIDLSHGAAKQLGMHGTSEVEVVYLED
ncbi:MAG: septal ring lytic transglycosylase RlpA family protein [Methylococcaceae bacterium]|nr:septal ring lytic transglycosylase RlpA family protein [Methylococcaceae bacterium]